MIRIALGCAVALACALPPSASAEDDIDFGRDILPILSDNCFQCHGPDEANRQAELRLDDRTSALEDRGSGAAIVPGDHQQSLVYQRITAEDPFERMPPAESNRKLDQRQIELLRRWIDQGAKWGEHWAFAPLRRPRLPAVRGRSAHNPIDAFIAARLEQEGLEPAPPADPATLARRVTLDLTGLPPEVARVDRFLRDTRPDAYGRLVDELLASPAFGERMAWDWLDAARYADSNGYQGDQERTMWPWRDWVVAAINENLPYDQFTIWQVAGDLLPAGTATEKLATGFLRNHMINGEGGRIAEENRVDYVMDMTETVGTVWLGLTVGCCRCHDHKFDPLSQKDYYRLFAFFNQTPVDGSGGNPQTPPVLEVPSDEQREALRELNEAVDRQAAVLRQHEQQLLAQRNDSRESTTASDKPESSDDASSGSTAEVLPEKIKTIIQKAPTRRSGDEWEELQKFWQDTDPEYTRQIAELRTTLDRRSSVRRAIPRVMVMEDQEEYRPTYVLQTGLYDRRGEEVDPGVPERLPPLPPEAPRNRLGLAQWLTSRDNPLTARVTVNRLWQQFFGAGLVRTPEDFGVQGQRPSHPELLDWLAVELIDSSWDVKHLCRLIVTSRTYRQSSRITPRTAEIDPENRLLSRGPRYRLASWMIRDQALAVSGLLVRTIGGPPVNPYQPPGVWEEATFGNKQYQQDHGAKLYRRSLYTFWRRIVGPTIFFDSASRQTCTVNQTRTNSPLHALTTLNAITYVEAARAMARRVLMAESTDADRVALAFRLVLARHPSDQERDTLLESLGRLREAFRASPDQAQRVLEVGESPRDDSLDPIDHAAYAALCSTILNLDEALSKE